MRSFRAVNTAGSIFAILIENDFKNFEVVSGLNLPYILIKVMHEFNSRLFCGNQKSQSWNSKTPLQKNSNLLTGIASSIAFRRLQFYTKQNKLLTLVLVHIFLWVKDRNATWRPNGIFKHNCPNVHVWFIYSLTYLCSQLNSAYHLHSVCIVHYHLIRWMM